MKYNLKQCNYHKIHNNKEIAWNASTIIIKYLKQSLLIILFQVVIFNFISGVSLLCVCVCVCVCIYIYIGLLRVNSLTRNRVVGVGVRWRGRTLWKYNRIIVLLIPFHLLHFLITKIALFISSQPWWVGHG